jgi:4a-hydroxytetrahydrobiopterin dehydratase
MWKTENNRLTKTFELKGFSAIINKLPALADAANGMNHHPDFSVHDYKRITFSLWTHSKNAITEKDHALAKEIDRIFSEA